MRNANRSLLAVMLLVLSLASAAFVAVADIDGKWVATMQGPEGPGQVLLDLKADGEKITGTVSLFTFGVSPISNGKITGSDVSFDLVLGDGAFTLPFKGKLEGEKLNLTLETPMGAETVAFARPPAN